LCGGRWRWREAEVDGGLMIGDGAVREEMSEGRGGGGVRGEE
jgi:hypothetical protein